jgi:hypothetical protein
MYVGMPMLEPVAISPWSRQAELIHSQGGAFNRRYVEAVVSMAQAHFILARSERYKGCILVAKHAQLRLSNL